MPSPTEELEETFSRIERNVITMGRRGVDVDKCTRYAEAAMCGNQGYYAQQIFSIQDENKKVKVFRRKSAVVIEDILIRLSEEIRKSVISKYYRNAPGTRIEDITLSQSSDNNRQDADLFHWCHETPIAIEVKFGEETNRNIGMETFERIFGTTVFTDATRLAVRKRWEQSFISEGRNERLQYQRLWAAINEAVDAFNALNDSRGFVLPSANQEYMEREILNTTGDGSFRGEFMKFVLDGSNFKALKRIPTGIGSWTIDRTEKIDGVNVTRCNVFVRNYDTNVEIKYVLNWKNNHPLMGNHADKVSAKLGLGTPNWNVWVEVEVTTIHAN